MVGLFNFIGSCFSTLTVTYFSRRPLLLFGHSGIFLIYTMMGFFTYYKKNTLVLVTMCSNLVVYQNTSGPIAWAYASETLCDVSLGMVLLTLFATVFVLNLTTQPLMDSKLEQYGVFWLFGTFNFFAIFYVYFLLPETKGLTHAEKRQLFYPG